MLPLQQTRSPAWVSNTSALTGQRWRLRTVGGDWLLLRTDGVGILDVRATLELDDGALVYTTYGDVVDLGPDGYNQFLKGILPPRPELRIAPRYYTSHADYVWLNRLQCVGVGVFDVAQSRVSYDVFAMRLAGVLDRTL